MVQFESAAVVEHLFEFLSAALDSRLRTGQRQAELPGNIFLRKTFQLVESHRFPVRFGKALHRARYPAGNLFVDVA